MINRIAEEASIVHSISITSPSFQIGEVVGINVVSEHLQVFVRIAYLWFAACREYKQNSYLGLFFF